MAGSLPVRTSIAILGFIAGLYTFITVLLLICACCLCYRKRKARSVSPKDYLSPPTSDTEEQGSSAASSRRTSTTDASTNSTQQAQLPNRYRRPKGKRNAKAIAACPDFEGPRNSPMLKHGSAWSGEHSKSQPDSYSKPATPDSGLAPSLKESKYGEPFPNEQTRSETPSSVQSSGKGSNSSTACDNADVFDEKMTETQASMSQSLEETKREIRRRAPKAARTESTTPLVDEDINTDTDLRSPSSEMEFDLKAILPPIKERKTRSLDSLEGSFFVNKSALECEENGSTSPSYTELKAKSSRELSPLKGVSSPINLESGSITRAGLLPPLFPPGHSQENLNEDKNEQTSAL